MKKLYREAIQLGEQRGAEQIELFILKGTTDVIQFEKNGIIASESKTLTGISVRAYTNKGLGLATTTLLTKDSILNAVKKAVTLSKSSPPDELFKSLPESKTNYPTVDGLDDKAIRNLSAASLANLAIEGIDSALEEQEVLVSGSFNRVSVEESIYNSLGIYVEEKYSSLTGIIYAKAEKNGNIATSWDYQKTRSKKAFNPKKIGQKAAKNAVSLLGAKKIESGKLPIILDHRSTLDTLSSILSIGLDAYEVILGTAFFKDRLGEQITNSKLTVIDNPLYPGGVGSAAFDDEGVPHHKTTLIKEGIAQSFFSNSYYANVLDIENTAHAYKASLSGKPHPELTQLQIKPGEWSEEELLEETKRGLLIKDTAISPSGGTPNISALVDQGFLIENGEIKHPVKETMVGITIFELLKRIDAISKTILEEGGTKSPMIRIEPVKIAGGK
jgi:PmbA protein